MRFKTQRFHFRVFVLAALYSLPVGNAFAQSAEASPSPRSDPWAGKTVKDAPFAKSMMEARVHNAPTLGKRAPKTVVYDAKTGSAVKLAEIYEKRPVVLYFANYSCLCSQKTAGFMASLHEKYGDKFQFLLVYIREAHPIGGLNAHAKGTQFAISDSKTLSERAAAAQRFSFERKLKFPILVDSMDDAQAVQWGAWPARLFVINHEGIVVYAGQQGPWFVKPTAAFDLGVHGVYEPFRNLPGYSRESLEEFLEKSTAP